MVPSQVLAICRATSRATSWTANQPAEHLGRARRAAARKPGNAGVPFQRLIADAHVETRDSLVGYQCLRIIGDAYLTELKHVTAIGGE